MNEPYQFSKQVATIHALRVNVKSLAAEAKLIRYEEKRAGIQYQAALNGHRRGRLREEARYAQLALAFVRGRAYRSVEMEGSSEPDASRLFQKLNRFTYYPHPSEASVKQWLVAQKVTA